MAKGLTEAPFGWFQMKGETILLVKLEWKMK